ncbi:PqqD family peptide modification chaperone [bacterium]|nr:PqqD family peptide modification chaperone [bacterium]
MTDWRAIPTPSREHCVRQVGDETLILTESGDEILTLNEVGSFIWEQLNGQHTLSDVLDILCAEYEVSREEAEADLAAFMGELAEHGLIDLGGGDA